MKMIKKVVLALSLISCVSGFAFGSSRKSQKKSPVYAKVEVGFEGGSIVNSDYDSSYAYFGVIKPTFGWAPIDSLPNLAFEGYFKMAFSDFTAEIEYTVAGEIGKVKNEATDFIFTPGLSAVWSFNPGNSWVFFAGGGIELPIEFSDASGKDSDTSVGFDLTATGGVRAEIDSKNEALASLNFSVVSHNSWGLSAGFLHRL